MSQTLIELLINEKISLNELKDWINLSSNEHKLSETTKYEFIEYFISNIHLSTLWLQKVLALNCSQTITNCRLHNNSQNSSPIKLSSNESNIKCFNNRSDPQINNDLTDKRLITNNKLKVKKLIAIKDLTKKVENLDLNDENVFPTLGSEEVVNKTVTKTKSANTETAVLARKKRIKPTTIKGDEQISFGFFSSSRHSKDKHIRKDWIKSNNNLVLNNFDTKTNNNVMNVSNDSLKAEREWLKRAKTVDKSLNKIAIDSKSQTNDSIKLDSNKAIEANPHFITYNNELKIICSIYAIILRSNLVINFLDEFKFICELVTKRVTKENNEDISHQLDPYLSSYHNCVHFSVNLLEDLLLTDGLINCLNKTTLKLLIESSNIIKFSSLLNEKLLSVMSLQKPIDSNLVNIKTLNKISFQSETDNKCNFPNDNAFHAFRRQRDEFYNIYDRYNENNNKDPHFKFVNSIKQLFTISRDSANMSHLSRLFVSQLLQSCVNKQFCGQNSDKETDDDNETVRHLLPDRERLKKLQKRFKSSQTPSDTLFLKDEQFFRDFIFYGDSHAFNEHLKLLLTHQLLDFDLKDLLISDNDFSGQQVLRNKLTNTLFKLKRIAKFLAYVTYYSFNTTITSNNAQKFIDNQTLLRRQSKPSIDLLKCLREAIDNKHLLVTISWIIEFISFLDPISSRTVYFENLYCFLVIIYKNYLPQVIQSVPTNGFFILLNMTKALTDKNFNFNNRFNRFIFSTNNELHNICSTKETLDFMNGIIDYELIHMFFPHFNNELTQILKQNMVNEVKKITPITMALSNKKLNQNEDIKRVEDLLRLQIEEQFFNSHSPSLKKTVDFVSDRITSKCIRKIKAEIFLQSKQPFIECYISDNVDNHINHITNTIQTECKSFVTHYCEQQISQIFPLLMNEDLDESVSQFSIKIATRLAINKCFEWIDNNITETLVQNDLKTESENMKKQTIKEDAIEGNEDLVDISSTFSSIRDLMADLYANQSITETSIIVKLINELSDLKRSKVLPKKTLEFIDINIVDFAIALIANSPQLLDNSIMKLFIDYWLEFNIRVEKFICPRNVYILSNCKCAHTSWSKFEAFILKMLSNRITTTQTIENDCLWTLKEEWNDSVLNRFASCLKSIVTFNETKGDNNNNDMLNTIDWLSWFCSQCDQ